MHTYVYAYINKHINYLFIIGLFEVIYGFKTLLLYPAEQTGKLQLFVSCIITVIVT